MAYVVINVTVTTALPVSHNFLYAPTLTKFPPLHSYIVHSFVHRWTFVRNMILHVPHVYHCISSGCMNRVQVEDLQVVLHSNTLHVN